MGTEQSTTLDRLNPCNAEDAYTPLRSLGALLANLYFGFAYGTTCACCMAVRLLTALTLAAFFGAALTLYIVGLL